MRGNYTKFNSGNVTINNYYLLNPNDFGPIVGKCTGFTHPRTNYDETKPIFKFSFIEYGKIITKSNAFDYHRITKELNELEVKQHLRELKLFELGIK